jgi:hypothetical protein
MFISLLILEKGYLFWSARRLALATYIRHQLGVSHCKRGF